MYSFLEKNKLLNNNQFGFRLNHSTSHALINLTEAIKRQIDGKKLVAGDFIDLEKAFDTVNHSILCNKLNQYGFRGKINDLILSFLSNRRQYVSINGYDSTERPILFGVPQGSTLGPLLFLLYINDLSYCLKHTTATHFADDICLIYASSNIKTIETCFNFDLKNLNEWLRASRLSLNIKKTKLLIFHSKFNRNKFDISIKIQGVKLKPNDQVKYLGLIIDHTLSWDKHINELCIKLSKANGILSKLRHFVPPSTLISVYYAIFYSHLNYSILVWSLTTKVNLEKIDKLQTKCIRIINFLDFRDHTINFFHKNKIIKFYDIIQYNQVQIANQYNKCNLLTQIMELFQHTSDISSHNTRAYSNKALFIPRVESSTYGKHSLRYKIPFEYNKFIRDHPSISDIHTMYAIKKKVNSIYMTKYIS